MRTTVITILLGTLLIGTTACATKRQTGAVAGAAGGAAVGGVVGGRGGAILGAALGGLLGYEAGRRIEEQDRERMISLEANRPMQWENPRTGSYYEVEPTETYYRRGSECREFRMLAEVERRPEEVWGTACRQPDGSWQIVET